MSDYLRKYLYELKAKSKKQAQQNERRERDRKIEAEIQADKAALTKELDKGIDWITPDLPKNTTCSDNPIAKIPKKSNKPPCNKAEKRLKDLENFIVLLCKVAEAKDINIQILELPVTRQMILDQMINRYPSNYINGKKPISLSSFEDVWDLPGRKNICGVIDNKFHDKDFFKNTLG